MAKFVLQSINGKLPNIPLNEKCVVIGRSPKTSITDRRLSKRHLKITSDAKKKEAVIEIVGQNRSILNGTVLSKGQSKVCYPGDKIELLEGDHKYELKMETSNYHHWSQGLYASMEDPEMVVFQDDVICIIKDKYPKAEQHLLVLPKEKLTTIYDLHKSHLKMVQHMVKMANLKIIKDSKVFKMGFHAIPSMAQVHMHVISQDFNSECLKNKKHWNSFNTEYFIPADKVLELLEQNGKITPDDLGQDKKSLLKQDLICNQCSHRPKNMPQFKEHLKSHL